MRIIGKLAITTAAIVTMLMLATPGANAGIIDGTLNSTHILTDIAALNTAINSDSQHIVNINANTRADGIGNNSIGVHIG